MTTFRNPNPPVKFKDDKRVQIQVDVGYRPWMCRNYPLGDIHVQAGTITDGNSRPWVVGFLLPRFSADTVLAAVIHDELYSERREIVEFVRAGKLTRKMADLIHRDCLVERGFSYGRAMLVYMGLRLGGWIAWKRRNRKAGIPARAGRTLYKP